MNSDFIPFWKKNFYHYGSNPSEATAGIALDWGQHCCSEASLFSDDQFVRWWEKRKYPYADKPSQGLVSVCQSWASHLFSQRRDMADSYLPCPLCGASALPCSGHDEGEPTWCEDDEADCPECGTRLRGFVTGDETGEWITAIEIEQEPTSGGD